MEKGKFEYALTIRGNAFVEANSNLLGSRDEAFAKRIRSLAVCQFRQVLESEETKGN